MFFLEVVEASEAILQNASSVFVVVKTEKP